MAAAVFVLGLATFLAVGSMAIDISHQTMAGVELQNGADAAAWAGATALNGQPGGIDAAVNRARAILTPATLTGGVMDKANTFDFGSPIVISNANITFAVNNGDFGTNKELTIAQAKGDTVAPRVRFIRVNIPMHYVRGIFTNVSIGRQFLGVTREAVASMSANGLTPPAADAPVGTPPTLSSDSPLNTLCNWVPLSALQDPVNFMPLNKPPGSAACGNAYKFTPGCTYVIRAGSNGNGTGFVAGGNFQALAALNPDGTRMDTGGSDLRDRIAGGIKVCIHPGDWIGTEPGENGGTVRQGLNARFGDYNGGLNSATYPPDINVKQGITYKEYSAAKAGDSAFQAPSQGTGVRNRRVIVIPIINNNEFNAGRDKVRLYDLGAFFLRTKVSNGGSADITAEYVGSGYDTPGLYNNPSFVAVTPDNGGRVRGLSKAIIVR
ncbi:MAG: hypothetical protein HOP19_14575 [Acidobacteria bacterium]|nr:hypothetical protein [Acidobacteriota bacterium]